MNKAFIISDIHGMYSDLIHMLKYWDKEQELLIMLGDYIDRGPQSDEVLFWLKEMVEDYPIQFVPLRGNHEQMLIDFLEKPEDKRKLYERNGGHHTLAQLLKLPLQSVIDMSDQALADQVRQACPWLLPLLYKTRYYYRFGRHIVVHAGVDLTLSDWRHTPLDEFIWIRDEFHWARNKTQSNIIFGHTPVMNLHHKIEPWVRDGKWGIDGGRVYGGKLFGLRVNERTVEDIIMIPNESSNRRI